MYNKICIHGITIRYKEENENTFESFTEIGSYVMFVKTINVMYRRPL